MNNTPNNPNRRPAGNAQRPQNTQAGRTGAPQTRATGTVSRPTGAARPTGARPAGTGVRPTTSTTQRPTQSNAQRPQNTSRPPQNNKKKGKLGKDGILAIIMLILVVVLAAIIIICCVKAIADTIGGGDKTTGTTSSTASAKRTDAVYTTPVAGSWNEGYIKSKKPFSDDTAMHKGPLVLVNGDYEYKFTDDTSSLVSMYNSEYGLGSVYALGRGMEYDGKEKSLELHKDLVSSLSKMLADMKEANATLTDTRKLQILSGYRTYKYQQDLYDKETTDGLTAEPGYSEHHTGYSFDLRIWDTTNGKDKGVTKFLNAEEQEWVEDNCYKYGFILRYTEDKTDITGILDEDWHFRYVGIPHATYMYENELCLEEYLEFLRTECVYGEDEPLKVTVGNTEYTIYYFFSSVKEDKTYLYVPKNTKYDVSGDNIDGYIVTVEKTVEAEG